jgi:glycosyl transferase family 1
MNILMLIRHSQLPFYEYGYLVTFAKRGDRLMYVPEDVPMGATLPEILSTCPVRPTLIIGPEWGSFPLPEGLTEVDIPTLMLQQDTYAYTHRRIRWSTLFDYVVLFHAGFEEQFRAAGHSRVLTMPWAILAERHQGAEQERIYDIGWVGRAGPVAGAEFYQDRQRILGLLRKHFRTNPYWERQRVMTEQEKIDVYCQSRVVVNVCRDDHPFEANERMFETLAAGALLIVRHRNELSDLGFEEGVHFLSYREESEIVPLVQSYLSDETARRRIADAGREKVLREHTYDVRIAEIERLLKEDAGRLWAPARSWPKHRVRLTYLDAYAAFGHLHLACRQWTKVARKSLGGAVAGAALIAGSWSRPWRRALHF